MEENLLWKETIDERNLQWEQPLMEDDPRWKSSFDGIQPLIGEDPQWNTTFDGKQTQREQTFNGRQHSMKDNLKCLISKWTVTFNGRGPLMKNSVR